MSLDVIISLVGGGIIAWLIDLWRYRKQREERKKEQDYKKRDILRVIAWDGIGDSDITSGFEASCSLRVDCLEYVRGIEKITHLRKEEGPFDVAIVDREFLIYFDDKKIVPMIKDVLTTEQEKKVEGLFSQIVRPLCKTPGRLGFPVRCGLNAMLINTEKAKEIIGDQEITTYGFLNNLDQYPDKPKIGIWNWSLPTLSIFLLAGGVHINQVSSQYYDENQEHNEINKIIANLIRNQQKLKFLELPHQVEDALRNNEIWVLPGGGGWNLPLNAKDTDDWKVIVPREGAYLWVECACILEHGDKNKSLLYIEYLLKTETQKAICSRRKSYKACPVSTQDIIYIPDEMAETSDKKRIFTDTLELQKSVNFRELPDDWPGWEKAWNKLLKGIATSI